MSYLVANPEDRFAHDMAHLASFALSNFSCLFEHLQQTAAVKVSWLTKR